PRGNVRSSPNSHIANRSGLGTGCLMHATDPSQSTGVALLRQAVGHARSSIAALCAELDLARRAEPERLPLIVMRARSLGGIARDAAQILDETLLAVIGAASPVPSLCPEDAAKGSGPHHRRAETEPSEETDPGSAW